MKRVGSIASMHVRAVVAATAVVATACGGLATSPDGAPDTRTVQIEMNDFAFTPSTITLKPGERATFHFKNVGTVEHEFMAGTGAMAGKGYMDDWLAMAKLEPISATHPSGHTGEGVRIAPHGSATLTIVAPPRVGEFEFGCFVEGHYERGMSGKLVVDAGVPPDAVPTGRPAITPATRPTLSPSGATAAPHPMGDMDDEGH
jgi:uncharacterized cupredoxin-like copper-binding protein